MEKKKEKKPKPKRKCKGCNFWASEFYECQFCFGEKCDECDMGNDVSCFNCERIEDEDAQ